jgi:glutathione S-transferase
VALKLYAHPFSSYSQKVLIALYENGTPFELRMLEDPSATRELHEMWPLKRFPVLVDGGRPYIEASVIIERLGLAHPGPVRLIPADPDLALDVRFMDRFFDNYVHNQVQKIVFDALRAENERDPKGVADSRSMLETSYGWLDERMADREWAAGEGFSLADCAAAPALFYADWTHPIGDARTHVRAYRDRLMARPSFARAIEEARPYRPYFPLGAPDRD